MHIGLCCRGGAGTRGSRGQMTGRGASRGTGRGGGPTARGRGGAGGSSMLPPAAQSYGTEGYDYVSTCAANTRKLVRK